MNKISFEGPAVIVTDMQSARRFYETLLGQEVRFSVGDNYVHFATGFSLWLASSASETIYGESGKSALKPMAETGPERFELYFETADLDTAWERLFEEKIPVVHEIRTQPWGQRCFRVRDPEGYLVEIGEPMSVVAARYLSQGLSVGETAKRTMLPEAMIEAIRDGKLGKH